MLRICTTNSRATSTDVSVFSFVEFNLWDAYDDMTNFQRNFNTGEVEVEDGVIYHKTEYRERRDHFAYFACSAELAGFDTQREAFLGAYRDLGEPLVVEQGAATNSHAHGWQPIGSHHVQMTLEPGETRQLRLELKVLADVGLLGFPNAGKSTLITAVSAARPKVADYPFTTLYPNLGVVRIDVERSFVIADIPGLIEGAAEGTGLGIQFLKHLQRTRLLLHLVDLAPLALDVDPVAQVRQLEEEMRKFDAGLLDKPRWLVFTKADLMPPEEAREKAEAAVAELDWSAPWYLVSSVAHSGTRELMDQVSDELDRIAEDEAQALAEQEAGLQPT